MANYEAVWDAVARKTGTITGIKKVYGPNAQTQYNVAFFPSDIGDTPVAFVLEDEAEDTVSNQNLNSELVTWRFAVRVYYGASSAANAMKAHAPIKQRFLEAWRDNISLFGTCDYSHLTAFGSATPEDMNGKPFLYFVVRLIAVQQLTGFTRTN